MRDDLQQFMAAWRPALESEMRGVLAAPDAATLPHYGMMQYHMGWVDAHFAPSNLPAGKRLRPMAHSIRTRRDCPCAPRRRRK